MRKDANRTPAFYSREEAAEIRSRALNSELEILCPRCGEALESGAAVFHRDRSGGHVIRHLLCHACQRCLSVRGRAKENQA